MFNIIRVALHESKGMNRCGVSVRALFSDSDVFTVACFVTACCEYRRMLQSYQEDEYILDLASVCVHG